MAVAFSVRDQNSYVSVEEELGTGHVTISIETESSIESLVVDGEDLARAIITASPTFAASVGELAQKAIIQYLGEQLEEEV